MASQPPPPPPRPSRSPWPFGRSPSGKKKALVAMVAAAAAIATITAVVTFSVQQGQREQVSESAPDVKFIGFEMDRQEIHAGENATITFNVESLEDGAIDDAKVIVTIEPQVGTTYLSISNSTIDLPTLYKDARTGEMQVSVTATGAPAIEAVYAVRGTLSVQDTRTDVRDMQLTILHRR